MQNIATSTAADVDKGVDDAQQASDPRRAIGACSLLGLAVEFVTAVRGQKVCLMCGGRKHHPHTQGCAVRRADAFIKTRNEPVP
jgi:hypothetical protein